MDESSLLADTFAYKFDDTHASENFGADTYKVSFIDVGQGDSELIQTGSGNYILIDANDSSSHRYIESIGVAELKYMVLTHPHSDHYSGMRKIITSSTITVDNFLYSGYSPTNSTYRSLITLLDTQSIQRIQVADGYVITVDNLVLNFYHPPTNDFLKTASKINDNSLLVRVSNRAGIKTLFTGDLETAGWGSVVSRHSTDIEVPFLKAAHHGSANGISQPIFNTIKPFATFISCGRDNVFHHPRQAALNVYSLRPIYRTDTNGTIILAVTGNIEYSITTEKSYSQATNLIGADVVQTSNEDVATSDFPPDD